VNPRVGVALIFLDVEPVGAREQFPIEVTQVIAWHVRPVLGEVSGEA
jgi:hypothetical protein